MLISREDEPLDHFKQSSIWVVRRKPVERELSAQMAVAPKNERPQRTGGRVVDTVESILRSLGDQTIDRLYSDRVRHGRTRRYALMASKRATTVDIHYTLLGIELKIGRRRLLCPDIGTARFLAVFARLGVEEVAVPYDITQVGRLADLFESAWQRMLAELESETTGMPVVTKGRVRNLLLLRQRELIAESGSGPQRPEFDQSTSQRRRN